MRYLYGPTRMAKIKIVIITSIGRKMEQLKFSHIWWVNDIRMGVGGKKLRRRVGLRWQK